MVVEHDRSYISYTDKEFMARGYAHEDLFCLRFQFLYTEEQCDRNRDLANTPELLADVRRQRNTHMQAILNAIAAKHPCYQYNFAASYRSDNWDLFFWCNSFSGERDYSYFTLTFNKQHAVQRRIEICESVMQILNTFIEDPNLNVGVQYTTRYHDEEIEKAVKAIAASLDGKSCRYSKAEGKIVLLCDGRLFFKKKYAKKYGYSLSDKEALYLSWTL